MIIAPIYLSNKKKVDPIFILFISLGLLGFLTLVNTASFTDKLFSFLFPKPPSQAATIIKPVRLSIVYQPPKVNGVELTGTEIAQKFSDIIATPNADAWKNATDAGYSGPFMYYEIFDQTEGPPGLDTVSAQGQTCAALGKSSYIPVQENSVTVFIGEFCAIHDSIVNQTAFDHDLDSTTDPKVAKEDWFLHDSTDKRITFNQGSVVFYVVNPANQDWREYFIARLFRALNFNPGDPINSRDFKSRIKATGIYLDNVGLGWASIKNNSNNKAYPKEFSSSTAFADAVYSFVQQIHSSLHDANKGYNYPVWANMIAGADNDSDWDRYLNNVLEGGFKEDFVLNWGTGPYSSTIILNQLTQAEKWINAGKYYIAVGQANGTTLTSDLKFSLAAFLLVTNGNNASYKLKNKSLGFSAFVDSPEYYYQLGAPKGAKFQKTASPLVYRRDFECGFAELDLTNKVGNIYQATNCSLGISPSPTTQPTPTPSPQITSTPTPYPSPTIKPSPTPTPKTDITSPVVSITNPANGSFVDRKSAVTISASATDNIGVYKVEFYIDNALRYTDTSLPYSYNWTLSGKPNSTYTIFAKAYDWALNNTTSLSVKVTSK